MTDDERQLIAAWVAAGAPKVGGGGGGGGGTSGKPSAEGGGTVALDPRLAPIQSCTSCHGTPPAGPSDATIPRLNGQNEEYLRHQLHAFARMERGNVEGTMNKIAAGMTDGQMQAAAKAYATAPVATDAPSISTERLDQFEMGKKIAQQNCYMCHVGHNEDGAKTNHPLIPVLIGQSERYLRDHLNAYHSGARRHKLMNELAGQMSEEEIDAVALYFSAIK